MALQSGNYIVDTDIDNWAGGASDADKLEVIERVEAEIERVTKDIFYEKPFDILRDGNGYDFLDLNLRARLLSVSAIYLLGVVMNATTYTWTANVIHRDDSGITTDDYLRWLRNTKTRIQTGFFPEGLSNLEIVGTMGWPQKLVYDNPLISTFRAGEVITGATNGYTAWVKRVTPTALWIVGKTGNYANDEEVEGGTSEATADVNNANGAEDDPPNAIKQACIILARYDNDTTLYTRYEEGSENIAGVSYSNQRKPLTGIREADRMLWRFVRKVPRIGVV